MKKKIALEFQLLFMKLFSWSKFTASCQNHTHSRDLHLDLFKNITRGGETEKGKLERKNKTHSMLTNLMPPEKQRCIANENNIYCMSNTFRNSLGSRTTFRMIQIIIRSDHKIRIYWVWHFCTNFFVIQFFYNLVYHFQIACNKIQNIRN